MKHTEYIRLKAQIEAEYKHKLESLETVWRLASSGTSADGKDGRPKRRRNGGLNTAIKALLPELETGFSQPKVFEILRSRKPELEVTPASVSSALRRLEEDGDIEIVERGAGQRPSTYQVKIKPLSLDGGESDAQSTVQ